MPRLCVLAVAGVMLTGCVSIPAGQRSALAEYKPSPNHALRKPTVIVLHYTVEDTLEGSRDILSDPDRKHPVSSHYLLGRDGRLLQLVPDHLAAWHAGVGRWGTINDLNQASIGIEIVNPGLMIKSGEGFARAWWGQDYSFAPILGVGCHQIN